MMVMMMMLVKNIEITIHIYKYIPHTLFFLPMQDRLQTKKGPDCAVCVPMVQILLTSGYAPLEARLIALGTPGCKSAVQAVVEKLYLMVINARELHACTFQFSLNLWSSILPNWNITRAKTNLDVLDAFCQGVQPCLVFIRAKRAIPHNHHAKHELLEA